MNLILCSLKTTIKDGIKKKIRVTDFRMDKIVNRFALKRVN